ncbi:hypothetical protein PTQ19_10245 [Microbacterium esteraromaticum]|uniref:hypothetical protein n=1 Tax=Microbacterium esteraromaticum TaxID=57043 RepID=UPI00236868AB|nr:hypothetical protein [Microbacterium esteraromaticum]WDH77901.1 hypothetical protein PTQ19_10245 [Microbacterium esteraromaticum]
MSDEKESRAGRWDSTVRRAAISSTNYRGFTLGDLRKLVIAAEGMGDDAEVTVEEPTAHLMRKDEWNFKRMRVHEEVSDD